MTNSDYTYTQRVMSSIYDPFLPNSHFLTQPRGVELEFRLTPLTLYVEYAECRQTDGILFLFGLFCEYSSLAHGGIYIVYRVSTGGIRHSYSCGCATGIREYLFNT